MLTVALALLKKYWKEVAVGVFALVVFLWIHGLYSTIDDQATKITQLTTANQILKDNNDKLQSAITANNAAIEKVAAGADATNKAFATITGTVKQQSVDLAKQLRGILAEQKPQTCDATIKYLIDAAKGYAK